MIHAINRFETAIAIGADFYGDTIKYLSQPFSNKMSAYRNVFFRGFKSTNGVGNINTKIRGVLPPEPRKIKQPSLGEGTSKIYFPECLVKRAFRVEAEITTLNVQEMVLDNTIRRAIMIIDDPFYQATPWAHLPPLPLRTGQRIVF